MISIGLLSLVCFDYILIILFFPRVGKCILAEELKILLHDKKLSELDKSERQEENLVYG